MICLQLDKEMLPEISFFSRGNISTEGTVILQRIYYMRSLIPFTFFVKLTDADNNKVHIVLLVYILQHILKRLQTVRPTQGMSKHEQLTEFERQMSYGIPTGTLVIQDHDQPRRAYSVMSHTSTNRSRPSSAKSHTSTSGAHPGRRSRPSSAKSNASLASNASMRSNVSKRSTMSIRSNMSVSSVRKKSDGKIDHRPLWDDRFSYS